MAVTIPPAPDPNGFGATTATSIVYSFRSLGNGGSKILEWQIGYGTSPTKVQSTMKSGGTSSVVGLRPATTYYFWARGRNAKGWGPWSVRMSRRTTAGAWVKKGTAWKEAIPYVKVQGVWKVAQPFVRSSGTWKRTG